MIDGVEPSVQGYHSWVTDFHDFQATPEDTNDLKMYWRWISITPQLGRKEK